MGIFTQHLLLASGPSLKNVCQSCGYNWRPGFTGKPKYWTASTNLALLVFGVAGAFFFFVGTQPLTIYQGEQGIFWVLTGLCVVICALIMNDCRRKEAVWNNRPAVFAAKQQDDDQIPSCLKFPRA